MQLCKKVAFIIVIALSVFSFLGFTASLAQEPKGLCIEFQQLLAMPLETGILRKQLEDSIPIGGKVGDNRYFNIDIDGDDVNDIVTSGCSRSTMPSDLCGLWIELSSGGKIEFDADTLILVRHHAKIYVIVSDIGPKRKVGKGKVYCVDAKGVRLVCSRL